MPTPAGSRPPVRHVQLGEVHAVDADRAAGRRPQAEQDLDEGRPPGAGTTDEGDGRAGGQVATDVPERGHLRPGRDERDVDEVDAAQRSRGRRGARPAPGRARAPWPRTSAADRHARRRATMSLIATAPGGSARASPTVANATRTTSPGDSTPRAASSATNQIAPMYASATGTCASTPVSAVRTVFTGDRSARCASAIDTTITTGTSNRASRTNASRPTNSTTRNAAREEVHRREGSVDDVPAAGDRDLHAIGVRGAVEVLDRGATSRPTRGGRG